jgi:hypothetical protein
LSKNDGAFDIEMPVENDARMRAAQQPLEGTLANLNGLPP